MTANAITVVAVLFANAINWAQELIALHLVAGHPGITHLIEAFEDQDFVYFILELCSPNDLCTRIRSRQYLPEGLAAAYFSSMVKTAAFFQQLGKLTFDFLGCTYFTTTIDTLCTYRVSSALPIMWVMCLTAAHTPAAERLNMQERCVPVGTKSAGLLSILLQPGMTLLSTGLMHRDFKPDNFLLTDHPDASASLKVADFGNSTILPLGASLSDAVGSVQYQAPEVQLGAYAFAADLWSLGVTLYNMLCGLMPFDGNGGKMLSAFVHFPSCILSSDTCS